MKTYVYYIGLACLCSSLFSCDDFLQKDPPSSPSEAIFWQKESDFESALTSCYSVAYDVNGFSEAIQVLNQQKRETWKLVVFKIISKGGCKIENLIF